MFEFLGGSPLRRARRAARTQRWAEAAGAYRRHLCRRPQDGAAWVQLGHCLKELGDIKAAGAAYRRAVREMPDLEDAWIQVALLEWRTGNRQVAITTLERGIAAVAADQGGGSLAGRMRLVTEMLALGARERLPLALQTELERCKGSYALSRYRAFREAYSVMPGAGEADTSQRTERGTDWRHHDVLAVIDARTASHDLVRATRTSVKDMPCIVITEAAAPFAGVAAQEFAWLLLVEGGTRLDPGAIERLVTAAKRTGASGAYCDHDHWEELQENWEEGTIRRHDPFFQPMPDPFWFRAPYAVPPCLLLAYATLKAHTRWDELFDARPGLAMLCAHVPLVLASRRAGTLPSPDLSASPLSSVAARPFKTGEAPLQVVIQTRDAPEMLKRCVDSLRRNATRPDLLDVLIMDNRSVLSRTANMLADWSRQGTARRIIHDEPFNWARANNLAVALGDAPFLLFLNNDVEIETLSWDAALRSYLSDARIGAVGARLLYPNRRIQHGGVIFGMGEGGPVHEGLNAEPGQSGPSDRWLHPRLAAAVTGAWLATTRTLFDVVEGFDERLPVAFNDIDFCLRCRAADRFVVQASDIVAVHRESATRGIAPSPVVQARERADWALMRETWGDALDLDPAYNPHWIRTGQPFDGIAMPAAGTVERWIAASARPHPWSIKRA